MKSRRMILQEIKSKYGIATYEKKERDELEAQLHNLYIQEEQLKRAKVYVERIRDDSREEMNAFKKKRLDIVEKNTQRNVDSVFPSRHFQVKFIPDTSYSKEVLELLVGENGRLDPTEMQNGRCMRQVIQLSICTTIQIIKGCKLFVLDEASNSADPETVLLVSAIVKFLIDNGFQVILIEQQRNLYKNLPRRQFNLSLNGKEKEEEKEVEVTSIHDFE